MHKHTSQKLLRIGILGAARIAPAAVILPCQTQSDTGAEIVAVAARSRQKAEAFAKEYNIPKVHDTYKDLLEDPTIDAIFNPSPNSLHYELTVQALKAGKHVLCEKPISSNVDEAVLMKHSSEENGKVLMEAFHWLYHPVYQQVKEIIESGQIGTITHLDALFKADFAGYDAAIRSKSHKPTPMANDIRFKSALAGGSLMDLGCYCISAIRHFTGLEPTVVNATAEKFPQDPEIDTSMTANLSLPSGASAHFYCTFIPSDGKGEPTTITIKGSLGSIVFTNFLVPHTGSTIKLILENGQEKEIIPRDGPFPNDRSTYYYQLCSFVKEIRAHEAAKDSGKSWNYKIPSSPTDAVKNMKVIDDIYRAAGMKPRLCSKL